MKSPDPELQRVFRGHRDAVTSVAFCGPALKQAVSGSLDGCVMAWNFNQRMRAFRYLGHQAAVCCVAYDSVHNLVASASKDRTVRLWTPTAQGRSTVLKAHTATVRCCAFSDNGSMLATCSDDKTVKLWSVPQQRFLASLNGHTNWVRSCQLSPDARLAVSGGDDHSVRVWDLETQAALHTFNELEGSVQVTRFHPNGSCIATGGTDGCIKLWDLRAGRIIQYYEAHAGAVTDASFHPSGSFLLSSALDGTLKVWDLQEGLLFYTLHGHEGPALGVSFSSSGQHFASAGADAAVLVWQTNFDTCLGAVAGAVPGPAARKPAGSMQPKQAALRCSRPVASKAAGRPKTVPMRAAASIQQQQQHRCEMEEGGDSIGAVHAVRQQQVTMGPDGSRAAAESASADCSSLPEGLAGVLQQVVVQLDVVTQTLAVLEERMSMGEDRSRRLEAALVQLSNQRRSVEQRTQELSGQEAGRADTAALTEDASKGTGDMPVQQQPQPRQQEQAQVGTASL